MTSTLTRLRELRDATSPKARLDISANDEEAIAMLDYVKTLLGAAPAILAVVDFASELAGEDCAYGDNCPSFGTRHGKCLPCKARHALRALDRKE